MKTLLIIGITALAFSLCSKAEEASATYADIVLNEDAIYNARQALYELDSLPVEMMKRCSPYDRSDYPHSPALEIPIAAAMGSVCSPYDMEQYDSIKKTDIEHIVAVSHAHDSGLCRASKLARKRIANDYLNLTLATPRLNRVDKKHKGFDEWRPSSNSCWMAGRIVRVKIRYGLSVTKEEKAALKKELKQCDGTLEMTRCGDE